MSDREFFALALDHLADRIHERHGEDITDFTSRILARIEMGARQYGDQTYLTRDNLPEASDEYADGISYPLFELQKLRHQQAAIPLEAAQLLADAMLASAEAHLMVTQARRLLSTHRQGPLTLS